VLVKTAEQEDIFHTICQTAVRMTAHTKCTVSPSKSGDGLFQAEIPCPAGTAKVLISIRKTSCGGYDCETLLHDMNGSPATLSKYFFFNSRGKLSA
jgi:hypothetical protein